MSSVLSEDQLDKKMCLVCHTEHLETLFPDNSMVCVFCVADLNERMPDPETVKKERRSVDLTATKKKDPVSAELAGRVLARRRLLPFVQRFQTDYSPGWVHKDICRRLEAFSEAVARKESPRLMLFVPPRHGKSTLCSVNFPAWHLGKHPNHEFIGCSYASSLAMRFSRKVRQLLRDPGYKAIFPDTELNPEYQGAEEWETTKGGAYLAAGVNGGITGKGAHILLIDDPVKNREDAESQNSRDSVYDWYTSTAYTRLAPGGGVLIILTRWHDDDLAGRLLSMAEESEENWEVVKYPAIAEEDEQFRAKGEALHPARYPLPSLEQIRRTLGPRDWTALYQQNPVSDEGEYFKRDQIQYYNREQLDMDSLNYYCAWDLAVGQKERNDFSVGLVVGVDSNDDIYIVDVKRGRFDGYNLVEEILDLYELWRPAIVGIERGQIELAIGPFLEKRVSERKLYEAYFEPLKTGRRDKEMRARAIQGRLQQGKVFFPRDTAFTDTLVGELLRFPNGVNDDQVDALAWVGVMLSELDQYRTPKVKPTPSWRDRLDKMARTVRRRTAMSA